MTIYHLYTQFQQITMCDWSKGNTCNWSIQYLEKSKMCRQFFGYIFMSFFLNVTIVTLLLGHIGMLIPWILDLKIQTDSRVVQKNPTQRIRRFCKSWDYLNLLQQHILTGPNFSTAFYFDSFCVLTWTWLTQRVSILDAIGNNARENLSICCNSKS